MKHKSIFFLIILTLLLSACGVGEMVEEAAAEKVAETIIEQAGGAEDVEIDVGDGSFSYSVNDGEGNEISVDVAEDADIDAIAGMGFNIALPDGLVNGVLQEVDENGEVVMINATFDVDGLTTEAFFQEIHETLTAAGFAFLDGTGELTQPDPTASNFVPVVAYTHEDGFQFSILWGEESVILGLTKGA